MPKVKLKIIMIFAIFALSFYVQASRRICPMGYYINKAELIIIANTDKDRNIFVKEVIKGHVSESS